MPIVTKHQVETFALAAGVVQPLITVPQIITIYSNRSATDVSLLTWLGYLFFGVTFLIYGLVFKLKPIWIGQIIWVIMQLVIVVGTVMYGS